jgi:hypothetical protein
MIRKTSKLNITRRWLQDFGLPPQTERCKVRSKYALKREIDGTNDEMPQLVAHDSL